MKKKIVALAAALMMFMGVVSASSINGDYKGNPIVKVMSNGKLLQGDEVPAQIYDGHTVVPISLLRQIGASVEWNQDTYSVDVKLPQQQDNSSVKFAYDVDMYRYIYFINDQASLVSQIMSAINLSSYSQLDKKKAIDQVNSLRNDINDDWVKGFSSMQVYSADINQMTEIKVCLDNIKQYLLKFDTASAYPEWSLMKYDINNLYNKYDPILQKNNTDVFNKSIANLNAQPIVAPQPKPVPKTSDAAIETTIDGEFTGWTGETIFKLSNGQIWQQSSFAYTYTYAFMPKVLIYKDGSSYKMKVDGVDDTITVKQIK